ncbi:hypothetical protein EYF80_004558 [Liparis tanakae]|uniref:Uncharacterized protein n=1 Tax=Liparis tanakae TaxID=230148 RepID=A0A4Z2J6D1_9TELE|nr:hypothetical protein EYF80_004558 [Liparis tanakae]
MKTEQRNVRPPDVKHRSRSSPSPGNCSSSSVSLPHCMACWEAREAVEASVVTELELRVRRVL